MKKKLILVALVALVAPAVWLGSGGGPNWADHNLGFGEKIAGSWLAAVNLGDPAPVEVLMTLNADGGAIVNSSLRWSGGWENTRYNTTAHGSWKRTGPCTFQILLLLFIQDNDGNLVMYEKIAFAAALTDRGRTLAGVGPIHLIKAGNDPLDPAAPVYLEIPGVSFTARPIR